MRCREIHLCLRTDELLENYCCKSVASLQEKREVDVTPIIAFLYEVGQSTIPVLENVSEKNTNDPGIIWASNHFRDATAMLFDFEKTAAIQRNLLCGYIYILLG